MYVYEFIQPRHGRHTHMHDASQQSEYTCQLQKIFDIKAKHPVDYCAIQGNRFQMTHIHNRAFLVARKQIQRNHIDII